MASNDVAEALLFLDSIDLIDYTALLLSVWNGSKTNISELLLWSLSEWLGWLINTSTGKNKLFEPTGAFKVYYTNQSRSRESQIKSSAYVLRLPTILINSELTH